MSIVAKTAIIAPPELAAHTPMMVPSLHIQADPPDTPVSYRLAPSYAPSFHHPPPAAPPEPLDRTHRRVGAQRGYAAKAVAPALGLA